jgi:DUF1365 family protein
MHCTLNPVQLRYQAAGEGQYGGTVNFQGCTFSTRHDYFLAVKAKADLAMQAYEFFNCEKDAI